MLTNRVCNNNMYNMSGKKRENTIQRAGDDGIVRGGKRSKGETDRDCLLCRNCAIYNVDDPGGTSGVSVLCVIYGVSLRTTAEKCPKFRPL